MKIHTPQRRASSPVNDEMKEAAKEALREWLDEKYAAFGRWSLGGILAAGLSGLVYAAMWAEWHK